MLRILVGLTIVMLLVATLAGLAAKYFGGEVIILGVILGIIGINIIDMGRTR